MQCVFCESEGGSVIWRDTHCRIVRANEADYPAFCRVIWNEHIKEMTDLPEPQRAYYMRVVFALEQALREILQPDKINIASLGNAVPHLHWHVVPRFADDRHFPATVWSATRRENPLRAVPPDFSQRVGTLLDASLRIATRAADNQD